MTFNRNEHLQKIHNERKTQTKDKVNQVIKLLLKKQLSINFNTIFKYSGVSKATLYNHKDIRERIEKLRNQQQALPSINESLRSDGKDAIISSLKRRISSLEIENKSLKKQLQNFYGSVYEDI
jgi:hypothetical protein